MGMNDRNFLDKIRKMKESGKSIGLTEMQSIKPTSTKQKLVESYMKPSLMIEDFNTDEGEEGQDISPDEQRDEENAFKDRVTQLVDFEKIKVFSQTVTWSGKLIREGIQWTYTLDDKVGCFINTEDDDTLQLTDDMLEVVKNIRAYYDVWSEEWSTRLTGGPSSSKKTQETEGDF
jgi:hypothetical protein